MSGWRSRRAAHASSPFSSGIWRSSSATSGARRSASDSASRPSAERATISTRSSAPSRAAVPSRMRRWSSAISTRVGRGLCSGAPSMMLSIVERRVADGVAACPAPGLAQRLPPEVATGLGAISRVARALNAPGSLEELAARALGEMRQALGLAATVLYLPDAGGRPVLRRFLHDAPETGTRPELVFEEEAGRPARARGPPPLFPQAAGRLLGKPLRPPARP